MHHSLPIDTRSLFSGLSKLSSSSSYGVSLTFYKHPSSVSCLRELPSSLYQDITHHLDTNSTPALQEAHPNSPPTVLYLQTRNCPHPTRTIYPTTYRPGEFFISTTYSTIAARAQSFGGQELNVITPLQLAQDGFHYQPYPRGGLACCFACQSAQRLDSPQDVPFQEMQNYAAPAPRIRRHTPIFNQRIPSASSQLLAPISLRIANCSRRPALLVLSDGYGGTYFSLAYHPSGLAPVVALPSPPPGLRHPLFWSLLRVLAPASQHDSCDESTAFSGGTSSGDSERAVFAVPGTRRSVATSACRITA
ncbi:hypothetical protein PENFLA_c099G07247 [Penicillium flavigenum]|uniref:Uncharacterized protein n=1 Tax=Penicillium flavigenum TaxID=254877 RepID=A0A1V6S7Y7_9EURO|nr:hypothetical protein PENFLA_c099G07247 [Penicillium flavigenum]